MGCKDVCIRNSEFVGNTYGVRYFLKAFCQGDFPNDDFPKCAIFQAAMGAERCGQDG